MIIFSDGSSIFAIGMKSKDLEKKEEDLRNQVQLNPADANLWKELAECLSNQDRWEEAEIAYKEALDLAPDDPIHWLGLGFSLGAQSRWMEAEVVFRQAIRMWPDNCELMNGLGIALYELGYLDESESAFKKMIQMPNPSRKSSSEYVPNVGKEGILAINFWRYTLQEGLKADEFFTVSEAMVKSGQISRTALAIIYGLESKHTEAEKLLREEISRNPENAEAWHVLGGTLNLLERYEESEEALRESIRLHPDNTNGWKLLGNIMREQGRDSESNEAYQKAEEIESRTKWNC